MTNKIFFEMGKSKNHPNMGKEAKYPLNADIILLIDSFVLPVLADIYLDLLPGINPLWPIERMYSLPDI